ncbi:hypothetical protein B0T26DRAFT_752834 [Lasiosphaeria miniovina]|uniref:Protein kinase domain-containing protein n=1 Tax=Lasiosphaeria miniovina TaxID=1954250 RepID=A0AA40AB46_9PEZI|nr:uncharacterized protein B0T26DRAFT_752834 [Lasiosphaeria miniovina]KAK0712621.1 hypothetical protein B0T26DRAFT_752834 [Lasiosphaeria miniovina]
MSRVVGLGHLGAAQAQPGEFDQVDAAQQAGGPDQRATGSRGEFADTLEEHGKGEVVVGPDNFTGEARAIPGYPLGCPVWIEWRYIPSSLSETAVENLTERVQFLGNILKTTSDGHEAVFWIPKFVGLYEDLQHAKRLSGQDSRWGFLYTVPEIADYDLDPVLDMDFRQHDPDFVPNPISLRDMMNRDTRLKRSSKTPPPEPGDRVKLAIALTGTFAQLHAAGWLHKGLTSDRIWFFRRKNAPPRELPDISRPFITGFDLSRPQATSSL